MYRVLLLGMGGDVSKGIRKALLLSELPCHIVGACISLDSEGLYLCDTAYKAPYASDPNFIPWLAEICEREEIDIVFTGVEENIVAIAGALPYLQTHTHAVFRVSPVEKLNIGGDKLETCRWLQNNQFPTPTYAMAEDRHRVGALVREVGFPLIAKPRSGKGSSGVFLIRNAKELERLSGLKQYIVEECIGTPDEEYTVGCYLGLHGELPTPIVMRRELKHGASWKVEVVENAAICTLAEKICRTFSPNGPLNIQLRLDKAGDPVPFELNVRFSGTTPMRAHFGFCDVKAMLYESLLHKDIASCFSIRKGVAFRYTEELYLSEPPVQADGGRVEWSGLSKQEHRD